MRADFQVNVNVKTNGKEAVDALERQIDKLKNETIKVKMDVDGDSNLRKQIKTLEKQKIKLNVDTGGNNLKSAKKDFQMLKSLASEISQKKIKLAGLDGNKNGNQISTLQSQIGQLETSYKTLYSTLGKSLNTQQIGQLQNIFGKSSDKIKEINARSKDYDKQLKSQLDIVKKFDEAQNKLSRFTSDNFGDSLKQKYGNTDSYERIVTSLQKAKSLQTNLNSEISKGITSSNFDNVNADLKEMNSLVQKATTEFNRLEQPISTLTSNKAGDATLNWLKNNSKAAKEYGTTLESLAQKQKQAKTEGELKSYTQEVNAIKAKAAAEGKTGSSPFADLKRAGVQIAQFAGVCSMIQNIAFQVPRDMIQAVKDVNAAQIELTKVSNSPTNQLTAYWDEAADSAKKYGAAISDVINSTADWSRLGYNLDEAKKLSDATTLMQKVGDNMTQESSSQGIISTLKGFQFDANEVTKIIDEVNEVANTQPIDTSGIFAGLERSASSMSAANNTLEQTIALITAANSVVQDPASVGTAFKTKLYGNCLYVQKCA